MVSMMSQIRDILITLKRQLIDSLDIPDPRRYIWYIHVSNQMGKNNYNL